MARSASADRGARPAHSRYGANATPRAAYERAVERFCVEREAAVARVREPARKLGTALRLGVPTGPGDTEIRLLYEFEAVAFRSPACADLMADYVARQVDMYAAMLEQGAAAGDFTAMPRSRRTRPSRACSSSTSSSSVARSP
jgi:hypothetical protein